MRTTDRRSVLKAGLGGLVASAPLLGGLAACARNDGAAPVNVATEALTDRVTLITGAPGNLVLVSTGNGAVLVDSGSADAARSVISAAGDVRALFNTHYHADQTGGNALFGEAGTTIHAHEITRQWLSTDYYVAETDSWTPALPEIARPTETFRLDGQMVSGEETIDYDYLLEAHTRGDIYVFFRDSNVLAVGDVASPLRDPAVDWWAGGWVGGRVDAMDKLLLVANDETRIVPAYGPVMTKAELQAERDMMFHLFDRTQDLIRKGHSAQDMLDAGVMTEIDRQFEDPYKFLYDASKSLWAHYTNIGGNIV